MALPLGACGALEVWEKRVCWRVAACADIASAVDFSGEVRGGELGSGKPDPSFTLHRCHYVPPSWEMGVAQL